MAKNQSVNSVGDLTSLLKSISSTSGNKDFDSLKQSIDNLSKILDKRAGKTKKSSEAQEEKEVNQRTLVGDIKDFGRGFISPFTEAKRYIVGGKKTMPDNINVKSKNDSEEQTENKVLTLSQFKNELLKLRNTEFEKSLLGEVVVIRKIVAQKAGYGDNKTVMPALSGTGLEPNSEEDKQRDRELLAEAIADKLKNIGLGNEGGGIGGVVSSVLEALGLSKLLKKTPPVPGGKVPPSTKVPGKMGLGGKLFAGASLALGAYQASEFLGETGYGDKMSAGAGKDAEKAFRENVTPTIDPVKAGLTPEEARNALGGSERDIEKLGGREALLKIANTEFESSSTSKDLKEQLRIKEQSLKNLDPSLESNKQYRDKLQSDIDALNKRIPTADMPDQSAAETARLNRYANIETKQSSATAENVNNAASLEGSLSESIVGDALKQLQASTTGDQRINFLKQLETENTDLKSSMESMSQILAPMISNRTIDNSTQTFVTSPPRPYPTSNGYNRWQTRVDGKL